MKNPLRCFYIFSNFKQPTSAPPDMHELRHRSRGYEQSPKTQLSGISPVLQLKEKLKCLMHMDQRILAEIKETNGRDFCGGDSVIVLCLSLQR